MLVTSTAIGLESLQYVRYYYYGQINRTHKEEFIFLIRVAVAVLN